MRIIVCGGRHYNDWKRFNGILDGIHSQNGITCIIQGGATGADMLGRVWATNNGIECQTFPAAWDKLDAPCKVKYNDRGEPYNALAGFIRNQEMIDFGEPDLTIGFPGGNGTQDMLARSVAAKVATLKINAPPNEWEVQVTECDADGNEIPFKVAEWLLPPDPNKPKKPRRAPPTPDGRYESQF